MTTDAYAAIQALARCTFLPGSFVKRFVKSMAALSEGIELTAKQEAFLKLTTWRYRKQIYALNPDFDMTWALDHPEVVSAIQRKRKVTNVHDCK